jgi:NAD(P) transhydrogenase subunit beta
MPVLEVWKAKNVVVTKRGMATGYAGVENPLFFRENVLMLFGDAKKSVDGILGALRSS